MTDCSVPSAHCPAGGASGLAFAGVSWGSGGYGRSKLPRSRKQVIRKIYEPIRLFSLSGRLSIFLEGGHVQRPRNGAAHWFASGLGIFSKQIEKYGIDEYLDAFRKFLMETRLQHVLLIEVDYDSVYEDRKNKGMNDIDEAIDAAKRYTARSDGEGNKVLISALGKTKLEPKRDLHVTVEGQYNRRHGFGKPGMEICVTGIPSILLPHNKEPKFEYKTRQMSLASRLADPPKLASFRQGCRKTLELVVRDYEVHLRGLFDIEKVDERLEE